MAKESNVADAVGVGSVPIGLIVIGVILLILFVMNCVAICSGDKKCALLKKILGGFYSLMGLIMIIVALVEGGDVQSSLKASGTTNYCAKLPSYGQGFYAALQVRAANN